jgi:uncharacterized protein with PIN domain
MKCNTHHELVRFKRAIDVALIEMKSSRERSSMAFASIELQESIDAHRKVCLNCQTELTRPDSDRAQV